MVYVRRVVADSQYVGKSEIAGLEASAALLGSEYLTFRPAVKRAVHRQQNESQVTGLFGGRKVITDSRACVRVGFEYKSPVHIGEVYIDFGRVFVATAAEGTVPLNLVRPNEDKPGIQTFQFSNESFPNPMRIEAIPENNGLYDPVEEGKQLNRKLSYKLRIRTVNDYPQGDDWDALYDALGSGKQRPEKIPGRGFEWFQEVSRRGNIITLRQTTEDIYGFKVTHQDIDIEGLVRENQGKNLFDEIEDIFRGFKVWYTEKTEDKLSRNSVVNFLSRPKNRSIRHELEKQRREELEERRRQTEEERGVAINRPELPDIEEYLDDNLDLSSFESAVRETVPGRQKKPLVPYVIIKDSVFFVDLGVCEPEFGKKYRRFKLYRVHGYEGILMTQEDVDKIFTLKDDK